MASLTESGKSQVTREFFHSFSAYICAIRSCLVEVVREPKKRAEAPTLPVALVLPAVVTRLAVVRLANVASIEADEAYATAAESRNAARQTVLKLKAPIESG